MPRTKASCRNARAGSASIPRLDATAADHAAHEALELGTSSTSVQTQLDAANAAVAACERELHRTTEKLARETAAHGDTSTELQRVKERLQQETVDNGYLVTELERTKAALEKARSVSVGDKLPALAATMHILRTKEADGLRVDHKYMRRLAKDVERQAHRTAKAARVLKHYRECECKDGHCRRDHGTVSADDASSDDTDGEEEQENSDGSDSDAHAVPSKRRRE